MRRKPLLSEARTDLEDLSVSVQGSNGTSVLTEEILRERRDRLRKQNIKLDHEIARAEQVFGDVEQMRREVLRANAVVKQSLFSMVHGISAQLVGLAEEDIHERLRAGLSECFNDLAFARLEPPPE